MKWKKAFTLMQATMLATGFSIDETIESVEHDYNEKLADLYNQSASDPLLYEPPKNLDEAKDIFQALNEEVELYDDQHSRTILIISNMAYGGFNEDHWEVPHESTFTRESLAQWFYDTAFNNSTEAEGIRIAKIIYPRFATKSEVTTPKTISQIKEDALRISTLEQHNKELIKENNNLTHDCKTLFLQGEQLHEKLFNLECRESKRIQDTNKQGIDFDNYANYLPVKGGSMDVLSKAFQKNKVKEWLGSAYDCNIRDQDAFANILLQNFLCSN
jgi:hypothetical protein